MSNAKIREGDSLIDEAEKHLKTGLFKWRADFDSAASCYQKAALAYKNGRSLEKAHATYIKAADCHFKNGFRFHAGKAYEEAAQVCKDMKDLGQAMAYFDRASELYLEDGTPDTAAMCLDKAGKIVQISHPEWAIASYMKAAGIYENEDQNRYRSAAELIGKVSRLQVGQKKYSEAIKSIAHEKKLLSEVEGGDHGANARLTCAIVLLHLTIGDQVTAEQSIYDACETIDGFEEGEEHDALHGLIEAYDQRNQEKASQILNSPLFKYMDTAYAKLARSLCVPGFVSAKTPFSSNQTATKPPPTSKNVQEMSKKVDQVTQDFSDLQTSAKATLAAGSLSQGMEAANIKESEAHNPFTSEEDFDLT